MPAEKSSTSLQMKEVHALLKQGDVEQAQQAVAEILEQDPVNLEARALRDRLDTATFRVAVVRDRNARMGMFEGEDVSPLLPIGLLIIAIACVLVGTWLAIRPITMGLKLGFGTEVTQGGTPVMGKGRYPIHLYLLYPTILYILAAVSFVAYRRYSKK